VSKQIDQWVCPYCRAFIERVLVRKPYLRKKKDKFQRVKGLIRIRVKYPPINSEEFRESLKKEACKRRKLDE